MFLGMVLISSGPWHAVRGLVIGLQKKHPLKRQVIDRIVSHLRTAILARVAQPQSVLFQAWARPGYEFAGCRPYALGEVIVGVCVAAATNIRQVAAGGLV